MAFLIMGLGMVFALITLVIAVVVLINAFQISTTKGFMVLCIPFYLLIFVWSDEFQHPKKDLIKMGLIVSIAARIVLVGLQYALA